MRIVIFAGVLFLCLLVWIIGILTPDTTEQTFLSWVAGTAESAKREAMYNSIEVQALITEMEEMETKLVTYEAACPQLTDDQEGMAASLFDGIFGRFF